MRAEDEGPGFSRLRWRLFWTAFAVRVLYILVARTYHVRLANDHFQFAWEMGRIARALATGYGFADPFAGHTGPTAWSPPVYPLLLAGIFKLFGVYTAIQSTFMSTLDGVVRSGHVSQGTPQFHACVCRARRIGTLGTAEPVTLDQGFPSSVYVIDPGNHSTPSVCQPVSEASVVERNTW